MIRLRNVQKQFEDVVAVDDLSVDIKSGELITLVGPSGSGKSTVLNMIAGHLSPTSGSILIGGEDVTGVRSQDRPTSMVFQSWALFPHMSVRENIKFPIEAQGQTANGKVEKLLEQVQLDPDEYAEKSANELSGGEQQRVALARSIAYDPEVLLLDEPLGSLDYVLQKQLRRELSDLNEALDMTFIYVTHSLEAALIMSDRIFVLNGGELIQSGRPVDIYRRPSNSFVAEFMGDANLFSVSRSTHTNGTVEITSHDFNTSLSISVDDTTQPDYVVVRHDDAHVASELVRDIGVKVTIHNKLVKGSRTLVETFSDTDGEKYIAEMDYDQADELTAGDTAYLQWNANDSIAVPG